MVDKDIRILPDNLTRFTSIVFEAAGLPAADAQIVAEALTDASVHGVDSHGIMRIPLYVRRLRSGDVNPRPTMTYAGGSGPTAVLNADNGMGHVAAARAMDRSVEFATIRGIGMVGVTQSSHFGAARFHAARALAGDCIGVVFTNGPAVMAPAGGREPRLSNNPIAVAIPSNQAGAFILDFAMSVAAGGKIRLAAQEGRPIPLDWALTRNGEPTTDPTAALDGALLSVGGHKGYGLALVGEALTGVLMGASFGLDVKHQWDTGVGSSHPGASNIGHALIAISVAAFMDPHEFRVRMDSLCAQMHSCPPAAGFDRVLVPGEIEHVTWLHRSIDGIPITAEVLKGIEAAAAGLGVAPLSTFC